MADAADLVNQARSLGEAIAKHSSVQAYMACKQKVQDDDVAQKLLKNYQELAQHLHMMEQAGKPIEPEMKRGLGEAEQLMASDETLKAWLRAQADYVDLMNQINRAMEEPIAATHGPKPADS